MNKWETKGDPLLYAGDFGLNTARQLRKFSDERRKGADKELRMQMDYRLSEAEAKSIRSYI